ncbi:heavy metal-associated domain-containing protein [Geobacillus stearothermophilus]|uniref:heavy-metal-associated domain-containing protein n=1 Tax=Geobacillus stearothermophilus TaxID=1422 RepID=UPI002E1EC380|nr:heavy metal-associated domain-containing protein [Geobacillus stearothermophilus]MED4985138.1 heavy metal-associated domain-containing protein [Geobacillus stearothermophilus]
MKTYRMTVRGMTCTGCEQHVARALEAIGAKLMDVSFQRGEAVFALPEDTDVDMARQAVQNAHYEPGDIFRLFLG